MFALDLHKKNAKSLKILYFTWQWYCSYYWGKRRRRRRRGRRWRRSGRRRSSPVPPPLQQSPWSQTQCFDPPVAAADIFYRLVFLHLTHHCLSILILVKLSNYISEFEHFTWTKPSLWWYLHDVISGFRASFSLLFVKSFVFFLLGKNVVGIHPNWQAFHVPAKNIEICPHRISTLKPAVLTVPSGLAVDVTLAPAPADVLCSSVVLQTPPEEKWRKMIHTKLFRLDRIGQEILETWRRPCSWSRLSPRSGHGGPPSRRKSEEEIDL